MPETNPAAPAAGTVFEGFSLDDIRDFTVLGLAIFTKDSTPEEFSNTLTLIGNAAKIKNARIAGKDTLIFNKTYTENVTARAITADQPAINGGNDPGSPANLLGDATQEVASPQYEEPTPPVEPVTYNLRQSTKDRRKLPAAPEEPTIYGLRESTKERRKLREKKAAMPLNKNPSGGS